MKNARPVRPDVATCRQEFGFVTGMNPNKWSKRVLGASREESISHLPRQLNGQNGRPKNAAILDFIAKRLSHLGFRWAARKTGEQFDIVYANYPDFVGANQHSPKPTLADLALLPTELFELAAPRPNRKQRLRAVRPRRHDRHSRYQF